MICPFWKDCGRNVIGCEHLHPHHYTPNCDNRCQKIGREVTCRELTEEETVMFVQERMKGEK